MYVCWRCLNVLLKHLLELASLLANVQCPPSLLNALETMNQPVFAAGSYTHRRRAVEQGIVVCPFHSIRMDRRYQLSHTAAYTQLGVTAAESRAHSSGMKRAQEGETMVPPRSSSCLGRKAIAPHVSLCRFQSNVCLTVKQQLGRQGPLTVGLHLQAQGHGAGDCCATYFNTLHPCPFPQCPPFPPSTFRR